MSIAFQIFISLLLNQHNQIVRTDFQSILDAATLKGTILLFDEKKNTFHSNDFDWAGIGKIPASTYKIPHSIIALETGVVSNDSMLLKWDGNPRFLKVWERNMTFKEAFQLSCVPCYQEVARKIGSQKMNDWVTLLEYGHMDFNSSTIDDFWLEGASTITAFQQIEFLTKFRDQQLPISEKTHQIVSEMLIMKESSDITLRGKTGWSITNKVDNGWFVGYQETSDGIIYFATNIEAKEGFDMSRFAAIRKEITLEALSKM